MRVLLIGAGFSRNWGGWLATELIGELCSRLEHHPNLLEMLRVYRNFEEVLGQRRRDAREGISSQAEDVEALERAIRDTFRDMNKAFAEMPSLNFSNMFGFSVSRFLHQFDAIFSLNQDLLLELNYDTGYECFSGPVRRWQGHQFPGVRISTEWRAASKQDRVDMVLPVDDEPTYDRSNQPIYKLHGSTHWRTADGKSMMVVGTGKEEAIADSRLLNSYWQTFEDYLADADPRLMVIGYSFADAHVNSALLKAADRLKLYVVDPAGLDVFNAHAGKLGNGRNEFSRVTLVGVSTRSLAVTFGGSDPLSFQSFERFLRV